MFWRAFRRLLATYQRLSPLRVEYGNFHLGINTQCTALNKDSMTELFEFCNRTFKGCTVHLGMVRAPAPEGLDLSAGDFRDAVGHFRSAPAIQKENYPLARLDNCTSLLCQDYALEALERHSQPIPCRAARTLVAIQSDGEVYPCDALDKSLGNLRDNNYDIKRLFSRPQYRKVVESIKKGECHCTSECGLKWSIPFSLKANLRLAWQLLSSVRDTPIV